MSYGGKWRRDNIRLGPYPLYMQLRTPVKQHINLIDLMSSITLTAYSQALMASRKNERQMDTYFIEGQNSE